MSETIQQKLLRFEVQPPEATWDLIAGELDQAGATLVLKNKLSGLTVTPPASAWEAILPSLEPEMTDPIAAELRHAAVTPPEFVWDNIESSLDSIPEKKKAFPLRYAAAAILIGLLGWGALQLFSGKRSAELVNTGGNSSLSNNLPQPIKPAEEKTETGLPAETAASDEQRDALALEQSKKTYARLDLNRKQKARIAAGFRFSSMNESANSEPTSDIRNRYVVLMTPEGNFIRVSKKLGDLVCCVSGEEQDKDCKDQVEKWRKQLACSAVNHPGNFGDILSMISTLQQNR